jgi:hypothetical protein
LPFEKSKKPIKGNPGSLAEILSALIWTMDDNGDEIMHTIERWLRSDDFDRVSEALELEGVFPFKDEREMIDVLRRIQNQWPDLSSRCEYLINQRKLNETT